MTTDYRHPIQQIVTGARGKILEAIIRTHNTYPVRQWARRCDVSHVQAGKLLQEFANMGLVRSEPRGRNIEYTPITESLLYKQLAALDTVALAVTPIARELLDAPADSIVGIFGSVARDSFGPGSDLDAFVIGDSNGTWLYEWQAALETRIGISVNVLAFTPAEWTEAAQNGERIVAEIRRDGVLLQGSLP
ncbi:MAG: nucleotidyltransferase domain-containing protein [Actinomycetota bacterium]|nr:nucleotidyltransferase domain-containing protein [Actinomycetota bacterium]